MQFQNHTEGNTMFEQGILAAVLDDAEVAGAVAEIIDPNDFIEPRHSIIFDKVLDFYRTGKTLDVLNMVESITNDGQLDVVGGVNYFLELMDPNAIYANADPVTYALTVKEHSTQRQLRIIAEKIRDYATPGSGMASEDTVAFMNSQVRAFSETSFGGGLMRMSDVADDAYAKIEDMIVNGVVEEKGVPTGFIDLDERIGGLFPGQMVIVAGRPGMGKTTLALDFARNAAFLADKTVAFFSLEMGRNELMEKIISAEAHVKHKRIRMGKEIDMDDWDKIQKAKEKFKKANFFIDDHPQLDLVRLQSQLQKMSAKPEGLDLVVIDYLQLMQAPPGKSSREQEIAEISRNIKLMSKEFGVPIIILAQLNRGNTNRTDKRPMASDLRESGSLEQDADAVLLVHRPEEYDPNDKPGITEIVVGKVRAGQQGIVDVMSLLEYSKFGNAAGHFAATEPPMDDLPPDNYDPGADIPEDSVAHFETSQTAQHTPDNPAFPSGEPAQTQADEVSEAGGGGLAW